MVPDRDSRILRTLADRYARSSAARTGKSARDHLCDYEELLELADAARGDARIVAERDLADAEHAGLLTIERHRRTARPGRVRFSPTCEDALFAAIGSDSPTRRRARVAQVFADAARADVPANWSDAWVDFCNRHRIAAETGASVHPFSREHPEEAREILILLPRVLAWESESLTRFASTVLCGDSKRLEQLAPKLDVCLRHITNDQIATLADLGILPNERTLLVHGPLRFAFDNGVLDLQVLRHPFRVDHRDIERAILQSGAERCLTVENPAMLHELAKLRSDTVLAGSGSEGGFAHRAVIAFLQRLPATVEIHHFGDSDPAGFDILRDLRERTGRPIRSHLMEFRPDPCSPPLRPDEQRTIERLTISPSLTPHEKSQLTRMRDANQKGRFEQESLGAPPLREWPFYQYS